MTRLSLLFFVDAFFTLPVALENKIESVLEDIIADGDGDPEPTFHPSLTPGITLLQDLISWMSVSFLNTDNVFETNSEMVLKAKKFNYVI